MSVSGAAQNVSSVQCYLWDITLLFAQRRDNIELAKQISHLQVSIAHCHEAYTHFICCKQSMCSTCSRCQSRQHFSASCGMERLNPLSGKRVAQRFYMG